jgi:hypothetical protein
MNEELLARELDRLIDRERQLHDQYQQAYQEGRVALVAEVEGWLYETMRDRSVVERELQAIRDEQLDAEQAAERQALMTAFTR